MNCARPPDIDALRAGVATMSDWVIGEWRLLAHRVISLPRSNSVTFGAKRSSN